MALPQLHFPGDKPQVFLSLSAAISLGNGYSWLLRDLVPKLEVATTWAMQDMAPKYRFDMIKYTPM